MVWLSSRNHVAMRTAIDLVALPYTFTQQRPLLANAFLSAARERGVSMVEQQLEALHRARILVPLLRVRRDGRAIASATRARHPHVYQFAHWQPTAREDLREALDEARLFDPAAESFIARRRLKRTIGELTYDSSVYLYSPHQLIALPLIRDVLPHLGWSRHGRVVGLSTGIDAFWRTQWRQRARRLREIVIAVSALEPAYYSRVIGRLSLPARDDFEPFERWRRARRLGSALRWLGVSSAWIKDAAAALLADADRFDPLGDWLEVVAEAEPEKWKRLRGQARSAMDLRIAAEVLLLYYDDLVAAGRTKPLPEPPPRTAGPFDGRLKRQRPLDALLTDFGLSPHPRLVLVVEGPTERLLFPRVMRQVGLRTDDDFISIQDAEGVETDLGPLLAYAVAPRVVEEEGARYLKLLRPPTRILIVLDPEGTFSTKEQRAERREKWVKRLMRTLPKERRTNVFREQIENLVEVITWRRNTDSFEFAHFTDLQLATAIDVLDRRQRKPSLAKLRELVTEARHERRNIDTLMHGVSKVDLADELWPVLERRIERALEAKTERQIPIVRVIDRAVELAHEFPRRNLVIALEHR